MNKKIIFIAIYILIAIVLPLIGKVELLFDWKVLFIMASTGILLATQPRVDLAEAKNKQKSDNNSAFIILICSLIGIMAPIIEWAYFGDRKSHFIYTAIGGTLLVAGVIIRAKAIHTLGKYFTTVVQTTTQHQLVMEGMYASIRHPSYLGTFISMIGVGVLLQAWSGTIIAIISILFAYHIRIRAEEQELVRSFGKAYLEYQQKTKKMIPLIW